MVGGGGGAVGGLEEGPYSLELKERPHGIFEDFSNKPLIRTKSLTIVKVP